MTSVFRVNILKGRTPFRREAFPVLENMFMKLLISGLWHEKCTD